MCSFTRKAELIEKAGYNGVVVFNGPDIQEEKELNYQLIRMPAKRNFKTKEILAMDFKGQAVLIDSLNGALLKTSLLTGSGPTHTLDMRAVLRSTECLQHDKKNAMDAMNQVPEWVQAVHSLSGVYDLHRNISVLTKAIENTHALMLHNNIDAPDGHLYMWNGVDYSRELPIAIAGFGVREQRQLNLLPPSRIVMGKPEDVISFFFNFTF